MPKGVYERTPELIERARAVQLRTHLGRVASAETKAKMSAARSGVAKPTEWREKMSGAGNGRYSHGHAIKGEHTRTYNTWVAMLSRCLNENVPKYSCYGARGITVCERWISSDGFLSDMGERPEGKTIDRINNDGNYEQSNCRWATPKEQRANQRARKREA